MTHYDVIVVGGGAAGMTAAVFAKRKGKNVLLCEKMQKLGKKLLVTGAGRCNLLNEKLDPSFYDPAARNLVNAVFAEFGKENILGFFRELGLAVYSEPDGRVFPVTNQAASVLKVLELELERLKVPLELSCEIRSIGKGQAGFELRTSDSKRLTGASVILCAGGKSYPALGADGSGYWLAEKFDHTVTEPVPCIVPLLVKDPWCHHLQGQKVRAGVSVAVRGKKAGKASGEVLFTQYGLSGTAVLDASGPVSIAINREKVTDVFIELDLVPIFSEAELEKELVRRISRGTQYENVLEGLLAPKLSVAMRDVLKTKDVPTILRELKHKQFRVSGTRGWNEAEFTAGGVPAAEVETGTLESKFQKGFFLAGEILDVGGVRGGYNLAWAWASGAVAGKSV